MKFPIVRLIGRDVLKIIYEGKKWIFHKGIDYTEIHPSFSAHLITLLDDNKNQLFELDNEAKRMAIKMERSEESLREDELLKTRLRLKTKEWKEKGRPAVKLKPRGPNKKKK